MTTRVYVDAVGAAKLWINSRTDTLVGPGNPLQKGAHLRELQGAADSCYAFLSLLSSTGTGGGAESPFMLPRITASIYGPTIEAVTKASIALADEIVTELAGKWVVVGVPPDQVQIWVGDDVSGPSDLPDGDLPRHLLDFALVMQPFLA